MPQICKLQTIWNLSESQNAQIDQTVGRGEWKCNMQHEHNETSQLKFLKLTNSNFSIFNFAKKTLMSIM